MASRRVRTRKTIRRNMKRTKQVKGGGKRTKKVKKTLKKGMNWMKCLSQARKELGIKGFIAINKGKDGVALYKRAKEICGK